jgi:20S proteasome alpha/beta subunit
MTTIVYRGGVMAADSRAYAGYNAALGSKTKIRRLPDGTLIGCSSVQPGLGEAVIEWYAKGARPAAAPAKGDAKFTLLVVKPDGSAFYASDGFYLSGPLVAPFFAIGSGEHAAQGALHAGCSAKQAVEIACKIDVWSAPPIVTLTHTARGRRA